jgi:hypothetical protein
MTGMIYTTLVGQTGNPPWLNIGSAGCGVALTQWLLTQFSTVSSE